MSEGKDGWRKVYPKRKQGWSEFINQQGFPHTMHSHADMRLTENKAKEEEEKEEEEEEEGEGNLPAWCTHTHSLT